MSENRLPRVETPNICINPHTESEVGTGTGHANIKFSLLILSHDDIATWQWSYKKPTCGDCNVGAWYPLFSGATGASEAIEIIFTLSGRGSCLKPRCWVRCGHNVVSYTRCHTATYIPLETDHVVDMVHAVTALLSPRSQVYVVIGGERRWGWGAVQFQHSGYYFETQCYFSMTVSLSVPGERPSSIYICHCPCRLHRQVACIGK